jgi:hypothetical protein
MATTIRRHFEAATQIIGSGDGYVTLSGTTESFSSNVDITAHDGAHVIVEINYDSTPTDEVIINLYGSLDGSNYDDTPFCSLPGDKSVDPQQLSFIIDGVAHFRIGVVQDTGTDSHDVRAYERRWDYESG